MDKKIHSVLTRLRQRLLESRSSQGVWVGELSSSALATATAAFALAAADRTRHAALVAGGLKWLLGHQNPDGGWGDTINSPSNLSATVLAWSALALEEQQSAEAIERAQLWLRRRAGSLQGDRLAQAVSDSYGSDRTFSAPILTMAALAGRLGQDAWAHVAALPFELAGMPQRLWRFLRLPVVSYAAPALIAIGQARFRHRPPACPVTRLMRAVAARPTLRLLRAIQPASGGFLEAAPLTSFVLMSLCAIGQGPSEVARAAERFLCATVRPDGSWPIDTNLSVWLTTLSINALSAGGQLDLPEEQIRHLKHWLLCCQHRQVHPYTAAAGGGWAWTDLAGGVPDADDTAGALLALRRLGEVDEPTRSAARAGVNWLLDIQNRDGGVPTFCRGWGKLPFDRSSPDLAAHAARAWLAWRDELEPKVRRRIDAALARAVAYLRRSQRADGAWKPLWFGNQHAAGQHNLTYGTAKVIIALAELARQAGQAEAALAGEMLLSAVQYLLTSRGGDGGWGGAAGVAASIEETALAVEALAAARPAVDACQPGQAQALREALSAGCGWLIQRTGTADLPAEPIGLYFARLWYFERLYPLIFATAAVGRARSAAD